ncbi:tyrosine-protein phosphatase [Rhodococcus daqingensis]|uniref:Tyrosine-protein phosphatase n=1 Tax=Rhodococcus daqingensis TaxID=2479363 RepID=A0ABW2RSU4_9NOCA
MALTSVNDFNRLAVVLQGNYEPACTAAALTDWGVVDGDLAWLDMAVLENALRTHPERPDDWLRRFVDMIDFAESKGWVDGDTPRVRAHLTTANLPDEGGHRAYGEMIGDPDASERRGAHPTYVQPCSTLQDHKPIGRNFMSHRSKIAGLLLVASVALPTIVGTVGVAQAEPALPPVVGELLQTGSAALGSSDQPAPDAPRLGSVPNFRDVAGTGAGYQGAHGENLNKGVFYRADAIVPNDADLATLEGLTLTAIYDLRSDQEVHDKADRVPAGTEYIRIPIGSGNFNDIFGQIKSPDEARNVMRQINRTFVKGANEQAGFKRLLTELANTDGAQVYHCTAGKDRTGWASMLLQSIAGVDDATVMSDYLLTNEYNKEWIAKTRAYIAATQGEPAAKVFEPLLGVEANYLQAGLDEIKTSYGSIAKYLTDGLGLSGDTIHALRAKLLS